MFNLTHFMKNFKGYMTLVTDTDADDPWGYAVVQQYEEYILDFIQSIAENFPPGYYSFHEFLNLCDNIGGKFMNYYYDELKKTELYKTITENETNKTMKNDLDQLMEDVPLFKKYKSSKKASKSPKKSSKSLKNAKSPKKALKSPKKG